MAFAMPVSEIGNIAPDFSLPGTDGKTYSYSDIAGKKGTVVVSTTRAGAGRVIRTRRHRENGWIAGDNLSPQKGRILLQLALTKTSDVEEIQRVFDTY